MKRNKGKFVVAFAFVILIALSFVKLDDKTAIPFTFKVTQGLSEDCFFDVKADGSVTLIIDSREKGKITKESKLSAGDIKKLNDYIEKIKNEDVYKYESFVCGDIQVFQLETGGEKYYMCWDGLFENSKADLMCRTAYILYNNFGDNITAKREFVSMVTDFRVIKKYSAYVNYWELYIKFISLVIIIALYICSLLKLFKKTNLIKVVLWILPFLILGIVCGTDFALTGYGCLSSKYSYILCALITVVVYPIYFAVLADDGNKYEKILSIILMVSMAYLSYELTSHIGYAWNYINYSYINMFVHYGVLPVFSFIVGIVINKLVLLTQRSKTVIIGKTEV